MPLSLTKPLLRDVRPDGPLPGDILLYTHALKFTRLIPWFTGSRYYHCGLYEGGDTVLEARPQGVLRRPIRGDRNAVFRVIPMPKERGPQALNYIRACLGSNYDPFDIAFIVLRHYFPGLHLKYSDHNRVTCGELVVLAWRAAGVDLFPGKAAEEVIPSDFARFLLPDSHDQTL